MSRRVSTRALVAHHLRSHAGGGAILGLLVLVLSLLATAAPLALAQLGDATVRDRIDTLSPTVRDVVSTTPGLPQIGGSGPSLETDEVWAPFLGELERVRSSADRPLPAVLGAPVAIARTAPAPLADDPRTRQLSVAYSPGFSERVIVVEGRLPEPSAGEGASVEIVLSVDTAAEMEWSVGEARTIGQAAREPVRFLLVGAFEPVEAGDDFWQHATSVREPNIFDDGNAPRVVTGTGFAHSAALADAYRFSTAQTTDAWFPADVSAIAADDAEQAAAALRRLTSVSQVIGTTAGGHGILGVRFEAEMTAELESALAQQDATVGVIAMLVAGPAGVAAAVLVLACRLILEGRRSSVRLLSARGASTGQLRRLLGTEAVLWGTIPALLGAAAALLVGVLAGITPAPAALVPVLLLGLAPIAILAVLAPSAAERPLRADLGRRGSRLRGITEGAVVVLALLALTLLFVRGYSDGVDVLLAATPLLLALVACLATLRLYPIPLRAVFRRARAGAELDGFLGSARALREPSIGLTPVLALVVGVSVAVSSGILLSALQTGVADASRARIGADMRVAGFVFTQEQRDRVSDVDGVAAVAWLSGGEPARLDIDGVDESTVVFVADTATLREVQGDGPGMLPPNVTPRAGAEPLPLVASAVAAAEIGSPDDLLLDGVAAEVVGVTRGPVPIGAREDWVLIDATGAEAVLGSVPSARTLLLTLDGDADADAVEEGVRTVLGQGVRIDTVSEVAGGIESGPAVQGVRAALLIATGTAALLSALAIVMTLALAASPRARLLALLRTLGARPRSATSLALWEIGPPAVAAIVAGTVFGAVVPVVVMAAVDLRPFTGSSVAPAYALDPAILALTLGGFVVAAVLLTALALVVSRRVGAAGALRNVEEG